MYLDKIWQPKSAWHLSRENTLPSLAVFPAVPLETAFAGRRVFGLAPAQRSVLLSLGTRMRTDVRHVVITPPPPPPQNGDSVLKAIPKYLGRPRILPFQQPKMHWCSKILKIILIFFSSVEVMVEQVMALLQVFCTRGRRTPPQRARWEIFGTLCTCFCCYLRVVWLRNNLTSCMGTYMCGHVCK